MTFSRVHSTHLCPAAPAALTRALFDRHVATGSESWSEKLSRAREIVGFAGR